MYIIFFLKSQNTTINKSMLRKDLMVLLQKNGALHKKLLLLSNFLPFFFICQ